MVDIHLLKPWTQPFKLIATLIVTLLAEIREKIVGGAGGLRFKEFILDDLVQEEVGSVVEAFRSL